ncbi:DNA polymerase III subunit gamma/tau [Patescibacteria group bacterium]|nr:DNA polymerase III subunit gamma/tau [Patescibacteria group bacterium]MCL5091824.1 DNA polymerase III subunit gamma/tau [Patescibacteria group bacterium]
MYYLKYRPHTLAEIDNTRARSTITKILESGQLPHAFLFVGQKGTGKTSTARIFAKAVNCLENHFSQNKKTTIEPCNRCANCKTIDSGASPDIMELDAASNRGIEEIKTLIKETGFAPMHNRHRIFIIDEAHMITHDGFNALLKTLEEPPAGVIFVLATTNLEKVPKTIVSRCVMVNFEKAHPEEIARMINRIAAGEKLKLNQDLIELVVQHSDRSFRDAAKILQDLVMQHKLETDAARQYLGIRSPENLLHILQIEPREKAIAWIKEFGDAGGSAKAMIEDLLSRLHELLLAHYGVTKVDDSAIRLSGRQLLTLLKLFNDAYALLKNSPVEVIPLEIAIMEYYNKKEQSNDQAA